MYDRAYATLKDAAGQGTDDIGIVEAAEPTEITKELPWSPDDVA